jgi:hypothetical protein
MTPMASTIPPMKDAASKDCPSLQSPPPEGLVVAVVLSEGVGLVVGPADVSELVAGPGAEVVEELVRGSSVELVVSLPGVVVVLTEALVVVSSAAVVFPAGVTVVFAFVSLRF